MSVFPGVAGILFKDVFDTTFDYYGAITKEHDFQLLKMDTKSGEAFRKGIYLTHVQKQDEDLYFRLLRCSTNLDGPTDNFRQTDLQIIQKVNYIREAHFKNTAKLNHVLGID